jgi:tetratricopeptide (TPR) repeat protein
MTQDFRLSKIEILIQQKKYSEAEKILSETLSQEPNNIHYLSLLAEVYIQQEKFEKANQLVDNIIGLAPDEPHVYYTKSRIAICEERWTEAEKFAQQAIELNPLDADYHACLANIKMARKQYSEALNVANKALELDAENLLALNIRSTALNKLNRKEESFATIEGALREDPNNAFTHSNYGWGLLENGNPKKALEHFKEALKNDPNYEYAQAGMLEAIKATNPIYRLFLKYAFWMSNLTAKYQWAVIIGFYFGFKALRSFAKNNESFAPFINPLIIVLAVIAFSTWVITPISNLFLRFNKFGNLLLDAKQKLSSNLVALSLLICISGIIANFIFPSSGNLAIAAYGFMMMLPLGVMLSPSKNKYTLLLYSLALALIGIVGIANAFASDQLSNTYSIIFFIGFIGFQWVANFVLIKENNN